MDLALNLMGLPPTDGYSDNDYSLIEGMKLKLP